MMSPNKLAVLTVLALLGSVSCQGLGLDLSLSLLPPTYPPPAPSTPPPPPPVYPPTATPQPAATPPVSYPPPSPSPSPPTPAPVPTPAPCYPPPTPTSPPPSPSPPTPTPVPTPPSYPSPPPPPTPTSPPPSPSPPTPAPVPTPPSYPSPPPPTPTSPPPSPSPPTPTPTPAPPPSPGSQLTIGYYKNKCGAYVDVEAIVKKHVNATDAGMQAGLVRMFFHDCFVRGCDGSILIDTFSNDTSLTPEKFGVPNFPSMRGFEVIDAAKAEIENACPNVVSCSDIVAFAARDASYFLSGGGINFAMPAGRYDGNVSLANETLLNLPSPFVGFNQTVRSFAVKGLDATDMVTLSGAHSIGRAHCTSFSDRLPPSNTSDMDPAFAATLQASCASANGTVNTVPQDFQTPDILDNQYYKNVLAHKVLFTSDASLTTNFTSNNLVRAYADFVPYLWQNKFAKAMVKMGGIDIKTAANGEIRTNCRKVNGRP